MTSAVVSMEHNADSAEAIRLRNALVDRLVRGGRITQPSVAQAMRAVPRHIFVPRAPLFHAYSDEVILVKQLEGQPVSSLSQPSMIAIMLEQLDLRPGQRVLEIGAGTGYTAALMADLVGERGHVVTLDIDADLVAAARAHLDRAGFDAGRVAVMCGDGGEGWPDGAPYDRIILAVGASDIAPAWMAQLAQDGRIVLPIDLRNNGAQFSIAFDKTGDCLTARSLEPCGFIRLRGMLAEDPSPATDPTTATTFGTAILATVSHLLPQVGEQLWRRRMNRQAFGRSDLAGLRLRAYPIGAGYVPAEGEIVLDRRWTRFVLDWSARPSD